MKKLIASIIFFLLIIQVCYSQTNTTLFLTKINNYRISKGLNPLLFSEKADSLVNSHNKYMAGVNKLTHIEIFGSDTIYPKERIGLGKENVGGNIIPTKDYVNGAFITFTNEDIMNIQLNKWKEDKLHNDILLDKKIKSGSAKIYYDYKKDIFVADFIAFE